MGSNSKFLRIAAVIIVALILQVFLVTTGHHDTPGKAAVEFSKAYFKLSPTMKERLCNEITENDGSEVVNDYLYRVADRAKSEGFNVSWMKMALFHIKTETEMLDENIAEVRIDCKRRRAANPLYALVAKIFSLGEIHKVEETLTLVNENGEWKVCGEPFELIEG